jgi:hypothetical protein
LILCPWFLRRCARKELLTIVVPAATLLFFLLFFNRLNIGIRYLLPVFPLLYLLMASIWQSVPSRWHWKAVAAVVVVAYQGVAAGFVHPGHLSYFNLACGGPAGGHRVAIDSNLDWGQDLYQVGPRLRDWGYDGDVALIYFGHVHPSAYGINYYIPPARPIKGVLAVSVQYLMGGSYLATDPRGRMVPIRRDHVAWLRSQEPVARAGSIWIFDTR